MLRPRIIPCLLLINNGLYKTKNFKDPKYVGDPLNAVKIFNEKEVDELIILDIYATAEKRKPNYSLIRKIANESRMPICYGGGINNINQITKIISLGIEKISISSAIFTNPNLIKEARNKVGSQSIVAVMDIKKSSFFGEQKVFINNSKLNTKMSPTKFAKYVTDLGAGEILVNSIERDGTLKNYDIPLAREIVCATNIPITMLGGAGSLEDIKTLIDSVGLIGCAAGSLFVFKGKYRAVLIQYPNPLEKENLFSSKYN